MTRKRFRREILSTDILILAFVLMLLSYTFVHTGAVLARYIEPKIFGYIAAFGIEGLVAVLSWRKSFRAKASKNINITLAIVLAISAMANVYEGYVVKFGIELTIKRLYEIDLIQALVGTMVTAMIPFLIFVAGEIMGRSIEDISRIITADDTKEKVDREAKAICEYCDQELKNSKPQTRSAHLRYCETYKEKKAKENGRLEEQAYKKENGH